MPAPVAAIAGGIGRGLLTGGRAAMAGGMRETIRGHTQGHASWHPHTRACKLRAWDTYTTVTLAAPVLALTRAR